MGDSFRDWWRRQSPNTKFSWIAFGSLLASKALFWVFERAATLAYEKLLEASVTPEQAASMIADLTSVLSYFSAMLSSQYAMGAVLAFGAIIMWPSVCRLLRNAHALFRTGYGSFISKVGKERQIAELARDAMRLARVCAGYAAAGRGIGGHGHPLWDKGQLTEDEKTKIWNEHRIQIAREFASVMDTFRAGPYLQARPTLKRLVEFGYIKPPSAIDHVTNTFCIDEIANALAEGAESAFRDVKSRGFNVDQYRSEALQ
jgi:hypothetical protein